MIFTQILAFATLVSSSNAANILGKACRNTVYHRFCNLESSAGFLVFVSLVVMIYEAAVIAARFLNFSFINVYSKVVSIVVSVNTNMDRYIFHVMCTQDISVQGACSFCLLIGGAVFVAAVSTYPYNYRLAVSATSVSTWCGHQHVSMALPYMHVHCSCNSYRP